MEDNFIMMVSKGKGLYPDLNNRAISESVNDDMALYKEIKGRLIIPENKDKFIDGVKDIYHIVMGDYYEKYGETIIPSVSEVGDFIDEENCNLIGLLLEEGSVHANNVITIYTGEVTVHLEEEVEEALRIMGIPFRTSGEIEVITRSSPIPYHDPYQMKMFGDELYE